MVPIVSAIERRLSTCFPVECKMKKLIVAGIMLVSLNVVAAEGGNQKSEKSLRQMMSILPVGIWQGKSYGDKNECYLTVEHFERKGELRGMRVTVTELTEKKKANSMSFLYILSQKLSYEVERDDNNVTHTLTSTKVIHEDKENDYRVYHYEMTDVEFENDELLYVKLSDVDADFESDPSEAFMMCAGLNRIE